MSVPIPRQILDFAFYTQVIWLDGYKEGRFIGDGSMISMATAGYRQIVIHYRLEEEPDWLNPKNIEECYRKAKEAIQRTGSLRQWFELGEDIAQRFVDVSRANRGRPHRNEAHTDFLERRQEANNCSYREAPCPF